MHSTVSRTIVMTLFAICLSSRLTWGGGGCDDSNCNNRPDNQTEGPARAAPPPNENFNQPRAREMSINDFASHSQIADKQSEWSYAILSGNIELIKEYIKTADINAELKDGMTPLMMALITNNKDIVDLFLKRGANVNAKDKDGSTVLHLAAGNPGIDIDLFKLLLRSGADTNSVDNAGRMPLHFGATNTNTEITSLLVKQGAKVNTADPDGFTPLFLAAAADIYENLKYLIENGADVNAIEKNNGASPLMASAAQGKLNAVKLLVSNGAKMATKASNGMTALGLAEYQEQKEVAAYLKKEMTQVTAK